MLTCCTKLFLASDIALSSVLLSFLVGRHGLLGGSGLITIP